nr:Uncharacterised protein [Raoultella sp. NCTC 9187]
MTVGVPTTKTLTVKMATKTMTKISSMKMTTAYATKPLMDTAVSAAV